jgi:cation:H+ antiporter
MLSAIILIVGLVLLVGGGALLVRGACEIATGLGISPLIVGLTVVGFGTSSPELVINVIGAARGATDLAFGNVVGSNISNLALVLGAAALMAPITIQSALVRRELPLLLLGTTILTVMALDGVLEGRPPVISRSDAIVLLLLFGIFIYTNVLDFFQTRHEDTLLLEVGEYPLIATDSADPWRWPMAIGGMAMLFVGGQMTVSGATEVAAKLGVSATTIGLFVVAIGTSLPELATSIIAAAKKEADLALGNIIGSNLFNSLVVLPASGLVATVPIPAGGIGDLVMSWALAAFLVPVFFLGRAHLGRTIGVFLLLVYAAYAAWRIGFSGG